MSLLSLLVLAGFWYVFLWRRMRLLRRRVTLLEALERAEEDLRRVLGG